VVKEFNQGKQKAGYYSLTWDGRNNQGHKVGPGVYFYRLQAGSWVKTRKMVVIR
jgi:flagellar hook assembly protein FlgD